MQIKNSQEDYLETIYLLREKKGGVRAIDIAISTGYSRPSVSNAMKKLREDGYVDVDADGIINLTDSGTKKAEAVYKRHTVLYDFLIKIGVHSDVAAEDACRAEHAFSDDTITALAAYFAKDK
ncbi:MAG: metal-dependent transcriptional regulator [Christensenellaceae bacterium]|jgi:Mn-dependent DtxR family transcriptional regulator|nr:metal-dependent transcriptional regulator [Christensenellaceae bacterium]